MNQLPANSQITGHRVCFTKLSWIASLVGLVLVLTQAAVHAANVSVANTNDSGAGSLRQAITDVSAAGTIAFNSNLAGQTISLASELIVNKSLTIDASGLTGGLSVSGGNSVRIFRVNASTTVTFRGLTLIKGKGVGASENGFGGAVYNAGATTVERCTFSGNSAANYGGGIHNAVNATLTVSDSTFAASASLPGNSAVLYGGAIFSSGILTVNGSTFDRNSGFEGGGIFSDFSSTLTVTNSTFNANTVTFYGGAIFNGSPRMSLSSSTLVGNHADRIGGGIYNDFFGTPSSTLQNSIVAQNTAQEGENIFGPWTGSNNLTSGDPKLSPLGSFGGSTKTMPPLPDSPAIDAGGATALLYDQRGQPRILRSALDVGAVEIPLSDYNPTGVTIYSRVSAGDVAGVFQISTDPDFLPTVSTFAGTGTNGATEGPRLTSNLGYPSGVAQDTSGNFFFADSANHRICMIGSDGLVVTIAGTGNYGLANGPGPSAEFAFPSSVALGPDNNVYVSDTFNHRICKLTRPVVAGGVWTVINLAGAGTSGLVEGAGSVARFFYPYGLTLDSNGNVYVADAGNNRIRKVTSLGAVSTYAGSTEGFLDSTTAANAQFLAPKGVVMVGTTLYVADTANNRIRKIVASGTSAGAVTTFAGSSTAGAADNTGVLATFNAPSGIASDGAGSLYIADAQSQKIRRIDSSAGVTTVAGTGVAGLLNGRSDIAKFKAPTGVVVCLDGNLLVADTENHELRRIVTKPISVDSIVFTDANGSQVKSILDVDALGLDPGVTYYFRWKSSTSGITQPLGQSFYLYDFPTVITTLASNLSPTSATLNADVDPKSAPTLVTFEYSTDPNLAKPYEVKTLAGSTTAGFADNTGALAKFSDPSGVVSNLNGDVFVADRLNHRIRKITPAGEVSTFAGSGVAGFFNANGPSAQFEKPSGLAIDASGNLYVADESNHRIRMITPGGLVSTFAGSGIAGFADDVAASAKFLYPTGVAVDAAGNVYVADSGNHRIRKIAAATGIVSTLAGTGVAGFTNGSVDAAQFSSPQSVAVDAGGIVLVADTGNHSIRLITAGNVSTLAGTGAAGFIDGLGGVANFSSPRGVAINAAGEAFVSDSGNHRIRKISAGGVVSTLAGSGIAGQVDSPAVGLYPVTVCQFSLPQGISINASGSLFVTQEGMVRKISRTATLPTLAVTPDATGVGVRSLASATDRPLLYGATYYFQARGTSYRDSVTGGILSFVTPRADISVFAGATTSDPVLTNGQSNIVQFGNTPTGQSFMRQFTISNPGSWALSVSSITLPAGFQLVGGTGVINPLASATFQITLPATTAGSFSGNVVINSDAPEKTVFSFPIAGVVLDPPTLITLKATDVGESSATFNATVNPRGSSTTVWFEWSQDAEFDGVMVSTLAGSISGYAEGVETAAKFNQPSGIANDAAGNTYIADRQNHRIRKIATDGTTTTFAGTGVAGFADGASTVAQFNQPIGLAMSAGGILYVADSLNNRIRAIDSTGAVSTFSGLGTGGFTDGIATASRFSRPTGLAIDSSGVLYVADSDNNRIRKVATDGSVSTLAGTGVAGSTNGTVLGAQFNGPEGIARDSGGFVYVTETGSQAVRKIAPDGFTSLFAGNVSTSGFFDATGATARFSNPSGLAVGPSGLLYVADKGNHRIRSINASGVVSTVAGSGASGSADGVGEVAQFFSPISIATTQSGNMFVGESGTSRVRKITSLQTLLQAATGLTGTSVIPVELSTTGLPTGVTYYYRAIATNGGGTVVANVQASSTGTFLEWQTAKFGADAGNALISGPSANPAGDGVSNLLKYAFGLDPLVPVSGNPTVMGLAGGSLTITYTKVLAATDLLYTVEWSSDLGNWSSVGVTEQIISGDGVTQQITASVQTAPAAAKFLRIHITLQ